MPAFATAQTIAALWIALTLGYLNAVDEIVMTALLPRCHQDVLSLPKALALRRLDLAQSGPPTPALERGAADSRRLSAGPAPERGRPASVERRWPCPS